MDHKGLIATAALAMAANGMAWGQDGEERANYLTILGTYTQFEEDRNDGFGTDIDDGAGIRFILGQQRASGFGLELNAFGDFLETGSGNGTDYYRAGIGLDALYALGDRTGLTPYALIGGGGVYNDVFPNDRDDYGWYANAGIGAVTGPINKYDLKLRAEVRYVYDDFEAGYGDIQAGLGLEIPLYGEPKVIEKIVERVKVVEVEASGLGDADNDGIIDSKDQCPNTPEGTRVDGEGCPLGDVVGLDGVTFELNSDRLRPDAKTILDDVAEVMQRYPEMLVEVAGHTDSIGSDAYNQQLSQKRAAAVRQYLVDAGIGADRMTAVGYGETEPVDSNDTLEGRERNRRVELRIQN